MMHIKIIGILKNTSDYITYKYIDYENNSSKYVLLIYSSSYSSYVNSSSYFGMSITD